MKGSELFARALESEGVECIFAVPGEENLDLLAALEDSSIRLVVTRHEQAAGFMAATFGRLTGRAGVCLATLGPGATNLVTAAAYAQLGAMPMLMITGQKPIRSGLQGEFQLVDVVDMMQPLTKYTRQIASARNIPARVREAFRRAEDERPGAVHLELPEDVARETSDSAVIARSRFELPVATEQCVRAAAERIERAKRPLLLLGAGANRRHACEALRAFVDRTGICFFSTQMGKGVVDERHERCLGTAALSGEDYLHRAIEAADLIINVGHDVVEKPPFVMGGPARAGARDEGLEGAGDAGDADVLHVNYVTAAVDPVYFPKQGLIGDVADSIERLGAAIRPGQWDYARFEAVKAALDGQLARGRADDRFPMCPQRVVADVREAMPDDGVIALDNGMYKIWFARNYSARAPNTVLLDNALATMGAGLPSAMAAKLVHPAHPVMAVCGDGGFLMNAQELETAVRLRLDLVVLLLRDDAYGMIKWKQAAMGLDDFGLDFGNPDFVAHARSFGAHGHRVEAAHELLPRLRECLQAPGVHLVDVAVDYRRSNEVLDREIKEESRRL